MDWEPEAFEAFSRLLGELPLAARQGAERAAAGNAEREARRRGLQVIDVDAAVAGFLMGAPAGSERVLAAMLERQGFEVERFSRYFPG